MSPTPLEMLKSIIRRFSGTIWPTFFVVPGADHKAPPADAALDAGSIQDDTWHVAVWVDQGACGQLADHKHGLSRRIAELDDAASALDQELVNGHAVDNEGEIGLALGFCQVPGTKRMDKVTRLLVGVLLIQADGLLTEGQARVAATAMDSETLAQFGLGESVAEHWAFPRESRLDVDGCDGVAYHHRRAS